MPLFHIRRNVPQAGEDDINAAVLRSIVCAMEYDGLRWVRSHWDREAGVIFCLYEASDREQVIDHARRARVPCDDIHEVVSFGPEDYSGDLLLESAISR
jgi:hypothetical protein